MGIVLPNQSATTQIHPGIERFTIHRSDGTPREVELPSPPTSRAPIPASRVRRNEIDRQLPHAFFSCRTTLVRVPELRSRPVELCYLSRDQRWSELPPTPPPHPTFNDKTMEESPYRVSLFAAGIGCIGFCIWRLREWYRVHSFGLGYIPGPESESHALGSFVRLRSHTHTVAYSRISFHRQHASTLPK